VKKSQAGKIDNCGWWQPWLPAVMAISDLENNTILENFTKIKRVRPESTKVRSARRKREAAQ